jgi:PAS domain S-box-containing protein
MLPDEIGSTLHQPEQASFNLTDARLRTIYENTPIGIALAGLDGRIMAVNPAILRITGYSEAELLTKTGLELSHPAEREKASAPMRELLEGKRDAFQTETRFLHKDGKLVWVRQNISIGRDPDCHPACVIVMVEDIDVQKRVSAELGESQNRFRTMFETSAVGIGMMTLDRKLLDANPALCQMLGMAYEEIIGQTPRMVTFPGDYPASTQQFQDLLSGKQDSFWGERRYVRKNGEVFWANVTMSIVRDEQGKPLYLIGMLVDIDEQKLAQENLNESQARFQAMFDNVSVGMSLMSLNRRVITMNQTAQRMVGYTIEELRDVDPADISYLEDRQIGAEQFGELVAGKRDYLQMEKRFVRKDGSVFWARVTYSLVHSPAGKPLYLVGLIEDINEQRLAAEKLAAQEAEYRRTLEQRVEERTHELKEANLRLVAEIEQRQRAEEALASKAAEEAITAERTRLARELHDAVTQTLFSASLIAEVLPELWEVDPQEARKSNEELRQLTRGALAEMRTLLLELRPAALTQARFADLLKQLCEGVIGRARLPVNLVVEGSYEMPPDIKVAFYRVTQESLNNIVKYSRATQVDIFLRLECCDVLLEIHDNGTGFDPSAIKPTSLGMRIMRERAEAIQGQLTILSQPGQGTTVRLHWNEDELIPISTIPTRGSP